MDAQPGRILYLLQFFRGKVDGPPGRGSRSIFERIHDVLWAQPYSDEEDKLGGKIK